MKKATILLVLLVYIVAFFAVGLFGIAIRTNYKMNYVNEILIEKMDDQPGLVERKHDRVETTKDIKDEQYRRFENTYDYTLSYEKGVVAKFRVKVLPTNSTYTTFTLIPTEDPNLTYEIKDETLLYITFNKRRTASFIVESTDGNKTQTMVTVAAL